ncbi:GntR family transcriptional regulator [Corynebacterium sp. UBA2622]|uniref:GntR family transcriptional regulator n=1 Tax=Corynebacterium sp. UBA2622 TaxID=1946393 RepID=UPI0025BE8880|nr:GntR family transcriptional regulator [Corynebacterium sp. UBA2622]
MTTTQVPAGTSKTERAYDWIRERIRTREYEPGHRLVLSSIAESLDVSVVPVREAIRILEAEGMVTYEHNVGARVSILNRREYAETMETVAVLEAAATALASPHATDGDLAEAERINEEMKELINDFDAVAFTALNQQFHSALFRHCPNRRLVNLVLREWEELDRHRVSTFRYVPERAATSVAEHSQLIALIRAKASPDYIETVARQHRMATLKVYLDHVDHPDTP